MKYIHQDKVLPEIADKSKHAIEALNAYMDDLHGTIITLKRIRSGQPRPCADRVDEAIIFCFQPNILTTNGPLVRSITRSVAEQLARTFVSNWSDEPKFLESRLDYLTPVLNPCGLAEYKMRPGKELRASAWHVQITHPHCD